MVDRRELNKKGDNSRRKWRQTDSQAGTARLMDRQVKGKTYGCTKRKITIENRSTNQQMDGHTNGQTDIATFRQQTTRWKEIENLE